MHFIAFHESTKVGHVGWTNLLNRSHLQVAPAPGDQVAEDESIVSVATSTALTDSLTVETLVMSGLFKINPLTKRGQNFYMIHM